MSKTWKNAANSPSQDSFESCEGLLEASFESDVDEYIWKILLGEKEELQNASEFSFQFASQKDWGNEHIHLSTCVFQG